MSYEELHDAEQHARDTGRGCPYSRAYDLDALDEFDAPGPMLPAPDATPPGRRPIFGFDGAGI